MMSYPRLPPTSTTTPTTSTDLQTFALLKAQIISIATALYGTHSSSPLTAFDVITYITPSYLTSALPPTTSPTQPSTRTFTLTTTTHATPTYGIALIAYTGPPPSPSTSWELFGHIEHQVNPTIAAEKMLADLQTGMGAVISDIKARGVYTIAHTAIPDLAATGSGDGDVEWKVEDVDAMAMDGCSEEEWQDFNFDIGGQTTLSSIREEE